MAWRPADPTPGPEASALPGRVAWRRCRGGRSYFVGCWLAAGSTPPGSLCRPPSGDRCSLRRTWSLRHIYRGCVNFSHIWNSGPVSHGTVVSCDRVTGTWYTYVPVRRRPARCTVSTRARLRWEAPWPPVRCEPPGTAHYACYSGVSLQRRGDLPPPGPVGRVGARSLPWGWDRPPRPQRVAPRALRWGPRQARSPDGPAYFAGPRCYIRSATFPKEGASRT